MAFPQDDAEELETTEPEVETEVEEKPDLPKEPADKNEAVEVQVQTRQQKKQNRFREAEEARIRAEERATAAERRAEEAAQRYQERLHTPMSGQSQPQVNPTQQRLMQIAEEKRRLHAQYQAVASQPGYDTNSAQHREFERLAENLENARVAVITDAQRPQFNEQDIIRKAMLQAYLNDHGDIAHDQKRMQWAYARWQQNIAEGKPDTKEMSDAVFDEARIKFGLQPRNRRGSRPDDATKRRLSGVSSQSAGASPVTGTFQMTSMHRKMAQEKYDKLPPREAWQKWANNEGKRLMERRAAKSG